MAEQGIARQPDQKRPLVVTVFNQKGGIGKTTTTVNLAVVLAAMGQKVVIVDLDSQSNATSSLGMTAAPASGSYQLVSGEGGLQEAMVASPYPGLWLCPASDELLGADIELAMTAEPHIHLRETIRGRPVALDVILIDCPPALGMLPVNALVASDLALLPVSPEPLAREGLLKAWRHIHRIRANLNPSLHVMGVLLTMVDKTPVHREFSATVRAEFGNRVLPVVVPRDAAVLAASAQEMPVAVFDPNAPAAKAYVQLACMVLLVGHRHGPGDARTLDLPDWLKSQPASVDHAALAEVLLRWRDELVCNAPPPPHVPVPPETPKRREPRPPEPAQSGGGRAVAMLLAGVAVGLLAGVNYPAVLALVASLLP